MSYYKSILTFLKNERYLALPGIGVWSIEKIPAQINAEKEVIPTSSILQFQNHFQGDLYQKQVNSLSKAWSCTDIEVRQVLLKLGSKILESSSKHESYLLPGLGYVLYSDNTVQFDSTGDIERSCNYYNQKVLVNKAFQLKTKEVEKPVELEIQQLVEVEATLKEIEEVVVGKKRSLGLYKYAAAAVLFIVIGFSGWNLMSNADRYLLPVKYDLDSSGYEVEAFNRSPESDGTENNIDQIVETADNLEQENILEEFDNRTPEVAIIPNENIEENQEAKEDNENVVKKADTKLESELSCIYILGSFGSSKNIERMIIKIENLGLSVHREKSGQNTRIGALIPCDDAESLSQLKQIEPNTWLLDQ